MRAVRPTLSSGLVVRMIGGMERFSPAPAGGFTLLPVPLREQNGHASGDGKMSSGIRCCSWSRPTRTKETASAQPLLNNHGGIGQSLCVCSEGDLNHHPVLIGWLVISGGHRLARDHFGAGGHESVSKMNVADR